MEKIFLLPNGFKKVGWIILVARKMENHYNRLSSSVLPAQMLEPEPAQLRQACGRG